MSTLPELMNEFTRSYGLSAFEPDEHGVYALQVDDLELSLIPTDDGRRVVFYAKVAPVPEHGADKLAMVLLELNHNYRSTQGANFSVDVSTNTICLERSEPISDIVFPEFESALNAFVLLHERWSILIPQYDPEESSTSGESSVSEPHKESSSEINLGIPSGWLAV